MNDAEIDERISAGLRALVDQAEPPLPYPGAPSDALPGHGGRDRQRPQRVWAVTAAAAVLLLVAGVALTVGRTDSTHDIDAAAGTRDDGFRDWGPGWHDLDTSGVPDVSNVSVAFLDGDLYLAGTRYPAGPEQPHAELYRFDPVTDGWSEVPAPDMMRATIAAAGDQLVARGTQATESEADLVKPGEWATWTPGDASWTSRGDIAPAAALQQLEETPLRTTRLVWTGRRVIDLTHGSVLDPATGTSTPLELPADIESTALVETTTPVWTGSLVVMTAWSSRSGVAWDADGRLVGLLPPPPDVPTIADATWAAAIGGEVVALAVGDETGTTLTARLDPTTGAWTRLDDLPPTPIPTGTYCSYVLASAADHAVAAPCATGESRSAPTFTLDDDRWRSTPSTRPGVDCCPMTATSGTDAAAFYSEDAPKFWISIWIPN